MVYTYNMENIKLCLPFVMVLIFLFSCVTEPKVEPPQEITVAEEITEVKEEVEVKEEEFDPANVSREYYDSTKEDVRNFIEELNFIIRSGNYSAWKDALSPEYFAQISSAENLRQVSDTPTMRALRIVLRTAEDYFTYVVVPSRANSSVDDIEFISKDRVKAFTVTTSRSGEVQRLRLYDLERTGNMWKIIN